MERLLKRLAWNDRLSQEEQDGLLASVSRIQPFAPVKRLSPQKCGSILVLLSCKA